MGRKASSTLLVYMNNQMVGTLSQISSGSLRFIYSQEWLQAKGSRPLSLSMPLREQPYSGDRVYNFFDNLLPDNESLRTRIQRRFSIPTSNCFDLLSYIGADCVGALQLLTEPLNNNIQEISAKAVTNKQIANILENYRIAPLGMQEDSDFRISIAGAQEKTAFLKNNNKWYVPTKATPTTHIFKLPIGLIKHSGIDLSDSIENEWLCLKILSGFGLAVNHATIGNFGDTKVLICERFDRKWNKDHSMILRLPQEDMCQVFGLSSALKYQSDGGPGIKMIMDFLQGSFNALDDRTHFFKSCFLFWVLGAIDGHAKNFSISIGSKGRFQLTPLYDVISAYPLADKRQIEWNKLKMAMNVQGKNVHYHWKTISLRHWEQTAALCHLPIQSFQDIVEEVFDNMQNVIDEVASNLPKLFPFEIAQSIFDGMNRVKNR